MYENFIYLNLRHLKHKNEYTERYFGVRSIASLMDNNLHFVPEHFGC